MTKKAVLLEGGTCHRDGNKGDELMLHAVLSALADYRDRFDLVSTLESGDYIDRSKLGLHQLLWPRKFNRLSSWIGYPVLRRYGRPFGILADEDLYAVINFVGYRYADFGARELRADSHRTTKRRKYGTKTIFLPQAYGPFEQESTKEFAIKLFDGAELIYARDKHSANHLEKIGIRSNVFVCPDITIPIKGSVPLYSLPSDFIVISPNLWMIERVSSDVASSYIGFLQSIIGWAKSNELSVIILSHAEFQDKPIISKLSNDLFENANIVVIKEEDALQAKGLIGKARLVISSRYHALVAGLSQNIPTIGTSWAHKYQGLFEDYKCEDNLLSPLIEECDLYKILDQLAVSKARYELIQRLQLSNQCLFKQVDLMWETVMSLLEPDKRMT